MFPEEFVKYTEEVLGNETSSLLSALDGEPPVSVRMNPYKTDSPPVSVAGAAVEGVVRWCRYGRYLAERPSFTFDPLFHAGQYYVQEASSMFVGHILESVTDGREGIRILDLCAAPGGKTTLYSSLAGLDGLVVANEVIRPRAGILADNVRKWGLGNVLVTNNDPSHFAPFREWFDVVAVDAPCSGEGMFRKNPEALTEWSPDNVKMCAARQRRILADIWDSLRPGGTLIYSTCTFNRYENEDNMSWLAENFDCEDADITVPAEWNIVETEAAGIKCFRFYPHKITGEGFFACAVRKTGQKGRPANPKPRKSIFADAAKAEINELRGWVSQPELMHFSRIGDNLFGYYEYAFRDVKTVSESLNAIHSGICMGQLFGNKLKPDHSLAMFHDLNLNNVNAAALDIDEAIRYLRREDMRDISGLAEGLNLVNFKGAPLGWIKRVGNRANNMYPKQLAILSKQ